MITDKDCVECSLSVLCAYECRECAENVGFAMEDLMAFAREIAPDYWEYRFNLSGLKGHPKEKEICQACDDLVFGDWIFKDSYQRSYEKEVLIDYCKDHPRAWVRFMQERRENQC